nr:MAG TPA: sulfur oxygenase reductase [Caudoviricetes sp.]
MFRSYKTWRIPPKSCTTASHPNFKYFLQCLDSIFLFV